MAGGLRDSLSIKIDALSRKRYLEGKVAMANSATATYCGVAIAMFIPISDEQQAGYGIAAIGLALYFQLKAFIARREIKGIRMAYGGK